MLWGSPHTLSGQHWSSTISLYALSSIGTHIVLMPNGKNDPLGNRGSSGPVIEPILQEFLASMAPLEAM